MENALLAMHVVTGIVFVGGSAVASSLFARYAPTSTSVRAESPDSPGERSQAVAEAMHRVTGAYGALALVVPAVGIALATIQGRMSEIWIAIAMSLTAIAGGVLALQIHPRQRSVLRCPDERELRRLSGLAGLYNLLWVAVVVLMVVRPGAATH